MALSTDLVGSTRPGASLLVSRSRLRFFAKATGQQDPVYVDVEAARRAGHRDLPVPPTFFFSVDLEMPDSFGYLVDLGVDLRAVLHGEQEFVYHRLAYAGDVLTARSEVRDVYEKRGGALQFIVRVTTITNGDGEPVAELTGTTVVRQLELKD